MTVCACGISLFAVPGEKPYSAAWYRKHRATHLAQFPASSDTTRAALALCVDFAESIEAA
jgi:hypothetical protein